MARRYHEIKGLAEYTAKTIVSDEEQWKKLLHTAGPLLLHKNVHRNKNSLIKVQFVQ